MRPWLALFLCACARPALLAPEPPPPAYCNYDATQNPTVGELRRAGFAYLPAVSQKLETPMAAAGAHTEIIMLSSSAVPQVRSLTSSRPDVASFRLASVGGSICQNQALLLVDSGMAGTTLLRLYDDGGNLIDQVSLSVAPTLQLELDRVFSDDAPARVLSGSLQGVHATTLGEGGVLVGTGAVRFRLEGDLFPFPDRDVAPPWWGGDALTFTGSPGRGRVMADVGAVHAQLSVEVIGALALDTVTFNASRATWPAPVDLIVSALVDGAPIYGAQCRWSWPFDPPEWIDGGWIGDDAPTHYRFSARYAGTFSAECTLPGRRPQAVELHFD